MKKLLCPISFCLVATFSALAVGQPATEATVTPQGINFLGFRNFTITPGDVDWWLVDYDGIAPLDLNTFFNNANGLDTEIGLYNSAGNLVGSNDDANGTLQSQLIFTNLDAGVYYLAVGLFNTSFGGNNFSATSTSNLSGDFCVDAITGPAPTVTGGVFSVSGTNFIEFQGALIRPRQVEVFQLNYDGFASLHLNTFFAETDTEIGLYDDSGILIAQNDDADGTLQSELNVDNLPAGTYYVLVGHFNTTYVNGNLSARSTSQIDAFVFLDVETGPVPATEGSFNIVGYDFFDFEGVNPGPFGVSFLQVNYDGVSSIIMNTFFNEANGFDTEIGLYNSLGFLIDANDDANFSLQSRLVLKDLPAGTYYLAAGLFPTTFGAFNFNVTSSNPSAGSYCVDVFTFPQNVLLGDVDGDGLVTLVDVAPFIDMVSFDGYSPEGDVNCDAEVNLQDIAPFVAILTGN